MAVYLGLPRLAGIRKVKPIWILLKQETVSGSGIRWAICKSAPHCRQITTPAPHRSVFYRPDALPVAQPTVSKHCLVGDTFVDCGFIYDCWLIEIDDMQFGFMKGKGTTDAIFMARQMQENFRVKAMKLYFGFVDLEKAFDRVPREVISWAMCKLGVEEWLVSAVMSMYTGAKTVVRTVYANSKGLWLLLHAAQEEGINCTAKDVQVKHFH